MHMLSGRWKTALFITGLALAVACSPKTRYPDALKAGWNGEDVCECIEDTEVVRVLQCTFPPGVGHKRHYHAPHTGYTLAGSTFRITDPTGVREVEVFSGSSFESDSIEWHEVLNIGDSTAVFYIIEWKEGKN
jgi:quercetin dioxygenase-like cupin family protein